MIAKMAFLLVRLFLLQVSVSVTWNYILRLPCTTVAKFSVIHRHRSLNGYLLREISGIDDIECTKKCVKEPRCKSYNIHSGRKICQLSYKTTRDRGVVLSVAHGWVYKSTNYNKTKIGLTCAALNPCANNVLCKDTCAPPFYECVHCEGESKELHCQFHKEINATWGSWGSFGECDRQCGGGKQKRFRICNTVSLEGGNICHGNNIETQPCNNQVCPTLEGCQELESNATTEGSALKFLFDDHIECDQPTSVLNWFRFTRRKPQTLYRFRCCKLNEGAKYTITTKLTNYTTLTEDTRDISQHDLDCNNKGLIQSMVLETTSNGEKFRYRYKCLTTSNSVFMKQSDCYRRVTPWNENGLGNIIYLDRLDVRCELNGFNLNKVDLKIHWKRRLWQYVYRCCRMFFW